MRGDGDGWVECGQGHRHWGRYGAAGLLLRCLADGQVRVLLQHRAAWTADGDTWGLPGGARDSHEDVVGAAVREAEEETGIDPAAVRVRETSVDDHGGWSYVTVLADTPAPLSLTPTHESAGVVWVPEPAVDAHPLHPGFARTWPSLRARPVTIVVDGANVVGSRPDGWWRDRGGAAARLRTRLDALRARVCRLPDRSLAVVRRVVLVVEGRAVAAASAAPPGSWVDVIAADGPGDDVIVAAAHAAQGCGDDVLVVTADRELRERVAVPVAGPQWLLGLVEVVD